MRCMACGVRIEDGVRYCVECVRSGQASYDVADRAGDVVAARSVEENCDHVTHYNSPIGWDREQCSRCGAVVDSESVAVARAARVAGE